MKKIICAFCFLLFMLRVNAQNITAAEYFFNTDPGAGLGISIPVGVPGTVVSFTTSIPTTSLAAGFHTLAIRTKDAGDIWSLFETRAIYVSTASSDAGVVVAAEYFIDTDPGTTNGIPISVGTTGNTINFTAAIPTTSLTTGFHTLSIRTRDAAGVWGLFENRAFYISTSSGNTAVITAAEFFIDTDPGTGNGTAANIGSSGNTVTFTTLIPAASLAEGFHTLAIRTRDADGIWGLFENRAFYISTGVLNMGAISTAEYFIDADPGIGNGAAIIITPGNTITQTFLVPIPLGVTNGQHLLAIRTRDINGNWGLFQSAIITVGGGTLPLDFISFTGKRIVESIVLNWRTENEVNTAHFVVEKSKNGIDFALLGQVAANNVAGINTYSTQDGQPEKGLNYYRLKQVDIDGRFKHSAIIKILFDKYGNAITVYPNPVHTEINIKADGFEKRVMIQVYNKAGQLVINQNVVTGAILKIGVANLAAGEYVLQLSDGKTVANSTFIKN